MPLKKLFACGADHGQEERERAFLENGGLVLEGLVVSCDGKPFPIRTFSYEELISATNNFDPQLVLSEDSQYKFYKGSLEGRSVSIKSYDEADGRFRCLTKDLIIQDVAISAKLGFNKNILKLVGCCLETPNPALVFEYAQTEILADGIYVTEPRGIPMSWLDRLKIARQIGHAIAYLHTAFSRPIIHRNIQMKNIFIDQHGVPKLSDFALSLSIPDGETHVETEVQGTTGYLCPAYFLTSKVTEKTAVYSFGVILLEFLTGKRAFPRDPCDYVNLMEYSREYSMNEIVDPAILAEEVGGRGMQQQLEAMLQLALVCTELDPEMRPTMVDVTKGLRQIERIIT